MTALWESLQSFRDRPPLISPDDTWTLWAIIVAGVAASIYLEQRYRWAAKVSGPVLALVGAMVLSNLRLAPIESPTYDVVFSYLVPVAIPLLLMRADIRKIVRTTGPTFAAFHVSALGTIVGALVAALAFRAHIEQVPEVAGIMTASYTGGAVNFFAVQASFKVSENLTNPLIVADNLIMTGMFILLLVIAGMRLFLHLYPHPHSAAVDAEQSRSLAAEHWRPKAISLLDIAKCLAFAVVVAAVSHKAAALVSNALAPEKDDSALVSGELAPDNDDSALVSSEPAADKDNSALVFLLLAIAGNKFVLITLFSVAAATLFHRQFEKIAGAEELGVYLLYAFFFVIGLPADVVTVITNVPMMFAFCLTIALVNLAVTLGLGRLLGLNLEDLLMCVNATLGGAPSAAGMAIAKGWSRLVQPGILVGIWGYAIGTLLGVAMGETLRFWF